MLFRSMSLVSCNKEISFTAPQKIISKEQIVIDIKGAVMFPGIYSVDPDALLIDVINLAGGLLSVADVDNINLVSKVENNQMIVIPKKDNNVKLLNLNQATLSELMELPGVLISTYADFKEEVLYLLREGVALIVVLDVKIGIVYAVTKSVVIFCRAVSAPV